ncbi:MAG: hypothetical protein LBT25_13740 [Candidatus Symbiothrix sp.]|jgi:hypothetical protein|nr:hypothetical protein [Candidatus Symbiothrix sp.]
MHSWNPFKKSTKREPVKIQSTDTLGLLPSQIIYVEGQYNKLANDFIQESYGEIVQQFKKKSNELDFIYFPKVKHDFSHSQGEFDDLISYFFPYLKPNSHVEKYFLQRENNYLSNFTTSFKTQQLFSTLGFEGKIKPGFLRLTENLASAETYVFEYLQLDCSKKDALKTQIEDYITKILIETTVTPPQTTEWDDLSIEQYFKEKSILESERRKEKFSRETIFFEKMRKKEESHHDSLLGGEDTPMIYQRRKPEPPPQKKPKISLSKQGNKAMFDIEEKESKSLSTNMRYDSFSKEYNVIENIKRDILALKKLGYYELLLKEIGDVLFHGTVDSTRTEIKLSRLYVDSGYNIYLPDYNNIAIKMTTLPKTLFILFLRHPEGILLKQLSDYEPELMEIYKVISNRENYEDMTGSIKRICTPLDKSINEKLSRIREAFVRCIAESYAEHYYVTGDRGEKKRIRIDRELVSLPEDLRKR